MNQINQEKNNPSDQVQYLNRWVDKRYFRVFVYQKDCQKLVESYDEYQQEIKSGLWFNTKEEAMKPKKRKEKESVDVAITCNTESPSIDSISEEIKVD
jgi:hypothetical protein